jgi:hypothetical protein
MSTPTEGAVKGGHQRQKQNEIIQPLLTGIWIYWFGEIKNVTDYHVSL